MSRKKKGAAEDLVSLVALAPWWVGVALAVVFYVVLHRIAAQPVTTAIQPGHAGAFVVQSFGTTLATFGQYLVPLICLVGAGLSVWKRRERKALLQNVVQSNSADALDGMAWQQFEQLVGEAFRLQGYSVTETGGGGADGGVDLVLSKGGEKFLVQCKQWRAFKVGVEVVRGLYGVMAAKGAAGGFVVTSGRFTTEATRFASGRNVTLVDGPKLHGLIQQAKPTSRAHPAPTQAPRAAAKSASAPTVVSPIAISEMASPACPVCSKPMVMRTAKRGANVGSAFWGCTAYPACKGTRPAA